MNTWFTRQQDKIILTLHVQPGAKNTTLTGLHGDALKIRLAAPPVEGRANEALLRFIADQFKVPVRQVELIKGGQSRHKRVIISNSLIDPADLLHALDPNLK